MNILLLVLASCDQPELDRAASPRRERSQMITIVERWGGKRVLDRIRRQ
ncbi:MAG: hypothetical protein WBA13_19600 [Microcoleaceae cyanobacterium]